MKYYLIILLVFSFVELLGLPKNYYMSSSTGNNSNTGLAPAQAWATLDKLNSMMNSMVAGDSILFKTGDTFYGSIVMAKNGTTALPIIISSYGTGAKPIISGLTTLSGWTSVGTNIWESTPAKTLKKNCNVLTINGVPQHVGRTNWMTYQSATSTTVTSSSLTGTPNYTGAEIVIRKNTFVAEKLSITAQNGSVLTTANNTQPINNGQNAGSQNGKSGNGFFLQRFAGSLDTHGEWYFNPSTNKMRIYSTVNPSTLVIKASYVDTVIKLGGFTNIKVIGLSVEGGGLYGLESYGAINIQVKNCDFNNNTKAIYIWNSNDALVDGNTIENSFNGGILVSNNQAKRISVTNNYIHNTGQLIGMGVFNNEFSLRGIVARTSADGVQNFVNITGNTVIMTGNGAIQFQGSNVQVFRNVTDSFANVLDDNGGIYTFVANANLSTTRYTNRQVKNNFISNAIGAPLGSAGGNIDVVGMYFDDQSGDILCEGNTISNIPGPAIQLNNPIRDTIIGNTVYNSEFALNVNQKQYGPLTGNVIKKNNFYPSTDKQFVCRYTNSGLNNTGQTINQALAAFAYMDSNYVRMKQTTGFDWYYAATQGGSYTFPADMNISTWRANSGHDTKSLEALPSKGVALHTNPTAALSTVSFSSFSKHDPALRVYDNSAVVPIWNSLLLLDNGTATPINLPPVATAPADKTITLPASSTSVTGSGSDPENGALTYAWAFVSGPKSGTVASPTAATTTLSAMTLAGDYQYSFTVTDPAAQSSVDYVQVHVLPAIPPANLPPSANAGSDKFLQLPVNSTTVSASGSSDPEAGALTYAWSQISGPGTATITNGTTVTAGISNLVEGEYIFEVSVTDNAGAIAKDRLKITLAGIVPANQGPSASAGIDTTIILPGGMIYLRGSGVDLDGTISTYAWIKVSGPAAGTITNSAAPVTTVTNLVQGTYQYRLTVTDNDGVTGTSTVKVTVLPDIQPANFLILYGTKYMN